MKGFASRWKKQHQSFARSIDNCQAALRNYDAQNSEREEIE
jgi:hypothetical protein